MTLHQQPRRASIVGRSRSRSRSRACVGRRSCPPRRRPYGRRTATSLRRSDSGSAISRARVTRRCRRSSPERQESHGERVAQLRVDTSAPRPRPPPGCWLPSTRPAAPNMRMPRRWPCWTTYWPVRPRAPGRPRLRLRRAGGDHRHPHRERRHLPQPHPGRARGHADGIRTRRGPGGLCCGARHRHP